MKNSILVLLLSILSISLFGQSIPDDPTSTPKYSNEFLTIGAGAEGLGMSGAFICSTEGAFSSYWNPAGLNKIDSESIYADLMHSEYFAGIAKYDVISVAKRIDEKSAGGFSIIRFGVDDIPNTTQLIDAQGNLDYDRITSFSAADWAFIFSYARELNKTGLTIGANSKLIYRKIGDFATGFGFGLDASINYAKNKWVFSAVGRDITSTINSWNTELDEETELVFNQTGNDIPGQSLEITLPRIILGAMRNTDINENFNLKSEANLLITTDGKRNTLVSGSLFSIAPALGINLGYKETLFIRGGIGNFQEVTSIKPIGTTDEIPAEPEFINSWSFQPNFGIGLRLKNIQLDYALTDIGNVSDALYSNVFSLSLQIN